MNLNVDELLRSLESFDRSSLPDDDARVRVLRAAQALCQRLETPYEWVLRKTWQEPNLRFCLEIADNIKLFEKLADKSSLPKTTVELATATSTDSALLRRILRHLWANGIVAEIGSGRDSYQASELSGVLATPEGSSGIRHVAQLYTPAFRDLPSYLESTGYTVPLSNRDGAFQHIMGKPGQSFFEWMHEPSNILIAADFNQLMTFATQRRTSWMDVFAPDALLEEVTKDEPSARDGALLVDIGGSIGTDAVEFRRRYPHVPGRTVLQELPAVIESATAKNPDLSNEDFICQVYDFFTPQPVHGARIYYMGSILHDWPDEKARQILRSLVRAMAPKYSRLLLNENVLPLTGCHPHLSALDLTMMTLFGSQERTEENWRELLKSEGLQLVAVHTIPSCLKSVLEVQLI